jgi:hypothetical protein
MPTSNQDSRKEGNSTPTHHSIQDDGREERGTSIHVQNITGTGPDKREEKNINEERMTRNSTPTHHSIQEDGREERGTSVHVENITGTGPDKRKEKNINARGPSI